MSPAAWAAVIFAALFLVTLLLFLVMEHGYDEARIQWREETARADRAEEQVQRLRADLFRERVEHGRTPSRVAATLELRRDLAAWDRGERPAGWPS